MFYWQINVTDIKGLTEVVIADGMGTDYVDAVVLQSFNPAFSGSQNINGSFGDAAIAPATAGSVDELAGHICMGHIYAIAKTTAGDLIGKIVYVPDDTATCEEAVAMHTTDTPSTTAPAPAASPKSGALARQIPVAVAAGLFIAAVVLM